MGASPKSSTVLDREATSHLPCHSSQIAEITVVCKPKLLGRGYDFPDWAQFVDYLQHNRLWLPVGQRCYQIRGGTAMDRPKACFSPPDRIDRSAPKD
jgi:hypothetical protein